MQAQRFYSQDCNSGFSETCDGNVLTPLLTAAERADLQFKIGLAGTRALMQRLMDISLHVRNKLLVY